MSDWAGWRTAFVVFGGLVTLESAQTLNAQKVVYLGGALLCLAASVLRLRHLTETEAFRVTRPLLLASALSALALLVTIAPAVGHHTSPTLWFRDVSAYFLLASVPVFALDLATSSARRFAIPIIVAAGLFAAASYSVEWLGGTRRHIFVTSLHHIVLPSFLLPSALISLGLAKAFRGGRDWPQWLTACALSATLLFVTGTRFSIALLAIPGVLLLRQDRIISASTLKVVAVGVCLVFLAVIVSWTALKFGGADIGRAAGRFLALPQTLMRPNKDFSYDIRVNEIKSAWTAFRSSPLVGVGPGYTFRWPLPWGGYDQGVVLDTGLGFAAKFGLLGLAALLGIIVLTVRLLRALKDPGLRTAVSALTAYLAVAVLWSIGQTPFEDKGFSFGLLLLMALALPDVRSLQAPAESRD